MTSSVMFPEAKLRASRLLQILLLLQNRGRMTAPRLAEELEVTPRTILRDVDAMTEAGLPIIVFPGHGGGIELGFDYRTRLTGLDADEAVAMGVILSGTPQDLVDLGLGVAADRARAKIWEAFPDQTRARMAKARDRFRRDAARQGADARRAALALAVQEGRIVRLAARSANPREVHPVALILSEAGWQMVDGRSGEEIGEADWGDVNISARRFGRSG
ncbi:MAG: HTH domain-containing protein [Rhodobacterales bacterium]|nr:HTH domain-containing protein [Rhodobacterales bacterium]